ncbi:hypothetical protein FHR24_000032 [Wenyingzhuangia heitensis]|uniref:Uncharacterized protein n=1 Tax=Wenyingzhuangia heitensis TaxID=1487859 RepID=A0ABX0U5Z8_9FLAO|nr:hypothetical protein [Wenyingzhuangia heitensis]NIJ43593.1 hypothetical protein [Wenyingzhuangia heitensis]
MITLLLQQLEKQQLDSQALGYLKGVFASQRLHSILPYTREDENMFFSAAIAFTLQENCDSLSKENQATAQKIIKRIVKCYPNFKNFKGGRTYNFFKTNPMDFFPNGLVMKHSNFFKLADDADDTVYVYLTDPKKQNHSWLKEKLIKHANGTLKWSFHKRSNYGELKTYSVYFGKKMHIETDACILSTLLLWSYRNKLAKTKQDKDSKTYLLRAITSKDYIKYPYLVSPCYPTTAQICYHISRLIKQLKNTNKLSALKPLLIDDIQEQLKQPQSFSHQLFFHISLLNLGVKPKTKLRYQLNDVLKSTTYFYTSIPLMIPNLRIRKLQKYKLFNSLGLRTKCDGYTTMLVFEYHVLYNSL